MKITSFSRTLHTFKSTNQNKKKMYKKLCLAMQPTVTFNLN